MSGFDRRTAAEHAQAAAKRAPVLFAGFDPDRAWVEVTGRRLPPRRWRPSFGRPAVKGVAAGRWGR